MRSLATLAVKLSRRSGQTACHHSVALGGVGAHRALFTASGQRSSGSVAAALPTASAELPLFVSELTAAPAGGTAPADDQPQRPPLLFVHGLLGSGVNFRSFALNPAINSSGRRVLTVDLKSHGRSPHSTETLTLEAMADDVAEVIQRLGLRGCELVGHSLGGKVGMMLALRQPALLSRLIVMDISPRPYNTQSPQWAAVATVVSAAAALDPSRFATRAEIDAALAAAGVAEAGMRSFVMQNLYLTEGASPPRYAWRIPLAAIHASMVHLAGFPAPPPAGPYPASHVPAVFIAGERSAYLPASDFRAVAQAFFPDSSYHVLPGAGHWLHADKPAEFLALLKRLLDG